MEVIEVYNKYQETVLKDGSYFDYGGSSFIFGGEGTSTFLRGYFSNISFNFLIRVQNKNDPTNDLGKKVYFDTNNFFTVYGPASCEGSGIIKKCFIAAPLKVIDFSIFINKVSIIKNLLIIPYKIR